MVHKPSKYVNDKDEKLKARYPSKFIKQDSLKKFILEKSIPIVGERSHKTEYEYDNSKKPVELSHTRNS